jgi:hypothetical protein
MTTPNLIAGSNIAGSIGIDVYTGNAFAAAPGTGGASNPGLTGGVAAGAAGANAIGSFPALLVSNDGNKATYETGVAAFSMVATPTAFLIIKGSATKTVRVKKIRVAGVATAQGNMQIQFQRWSTAGAIGSAVLTALTAVAHDIQDPPATATVSTVGTANWTTQGTGTANPFLCDRIFMGVVATGIVTPNEFNFATRSDKAIVLRGTSDWLVLSGNGSAIPTGGVVDISVEWEEDNS